MTELTLEQKSSILYKEGFLRYQDKENLDRIEKRWVIYQTVPQKTARGNKPTEASPKKKG
jgi:hypothetical protein